MHLQLLIPYACWPEKSEIAQISAGISVPAFSLLCGRGRREQFAPLGYRDWLAQVLGLPVFSAGPLTLLAERPDAATGYWLRADPVHLAVSQFGASMADPRGLNVTQDEAGQLLTSLNELFAGDGMYFIATAPDRWLLRLDEMPQVSFVELESVFGHEAIGDCLPQGSDAARWHRLLNEIQMLLYTHPVNDRRASLGLPLINSLWLWGGGAYPLRGDLKKPAECLLANQPMFAALARLAGAQGAPCPDSLDGLPNKDGIVVLDELAHPAQWGDVPAWHEAWSRLENDWFAPARKWLSAGKISKLELVFPDAGIRIVLGRRDLLCLWRRPWLPW